VYEVGPVRAPGARELAAVLACGPRAVLSHRSAGVRWKLCAAESPPSPVDVTVPRGDHRRHPGIRVHRPVGLAADEVTRLDGIPLTTPARTLLDLAGSERPKTAERALGEALVRRLTTPAEVSALLKRYPNRPGSFLLASLLAQERGDGIACSPAEEHLIELLRKARLPMPEVNARLLGRERDLVWRRQRLVVEVDGYRFHSSRRRFEDDRRRDGDLVGAGFRVLRVTWRQMDEEPEAALARIAQALAR
jgi:very-short-patch-repair endonuclease